MMKDVRKALGTFWRLHFLQGVIFEDFHQKYGFQGPWRQFSGSLPRSCAKAKMKEVVRSTLP